MVDTASLSFNSTPPSATPNNINSGNGGNPPLFMPVSDITTLSSQVVMVVIFSLLWFWLTIILLTSTYGLFRTLLQMLPFSTRSFLGHHLRAHDLYDMDDSGAVDAFIRKCPADVTLMLRLYQVELGNTLTGEILGQLFIMFKRNYVLLEDSTTGQLP